MKEIRTPISEAEIMNLRAGDAVRISGTVYTARDAAHKKLTELLKDGEDLPFDISGSAIYYVGPTPKKPDRVIGSAGPTSSYRMDPYTEPLLEMGLKVMIGKGPRGEEIKEMLKKHKAVYLCAVGGAAAQISESIKACELILYPELGAEAVYKLEAEDFYAVVTYDAYGGDLFSEGAVRYEKPII